MKKLFLFAATMALTLASCSNDEDLGPANQTGKAIEFRSLTDKGTKAAITDETSLLSFTVTGIKMKATDPKVDGYLFNGFGITRGEDGGDKWDYTPKRYWPKDRTVDFYAYSPSSSRNVKTGITNYVAGGSITYTVPPISDKNAQEDFLVARLTGQNGGSDGNTFVKLNFHHALSRVMFLARTTQKNVTYTIDTIELVNLYETGTLNLSNSVIKETGSLDYSATLQPWVQTGNKVNYKVDMGNSPIYLLNDYASVLGVTNAVMILPQATTLGTTGTTAPTGGAFAIKVSYKAFVDDIYYAGSATKSEVKYFAVKDPVTGSALTFEMGRQYNFFLEFGDEVGKAIKFDVGVSEWNNTPNVYLPEITNYKDLISDELKGYAGLGTGDLTADDLKGITGLTITITKNNAVPDLTGIEYLPVATITVNTGSNGDSNPLYTCTKLDLSKCSVLKKINLEYMVQVTKLIVPSYFPSSGNISTGNGDYSTCEYPDGTNRPRT